MEYIRLWLYTFQRSNIFSSPANRHNLCSCKHNEMRMYVITGAGTKVGAFLVWFSVSVFSSCSKFNLCNGEMENETCCTHRRTYDFLCNCWETSVTKLWKKAIYVTNGVQQHHKPNPEIYSRSQKYQSSLPNTSCMTAILSTKRLFVDSGKKYSQFLSHDAHLSKLSPSPFFSFCVRPAFVQAVMRSDS